MAKLNGATAKRYGNNALESIVAALKEMRQQQPDGSWVLSHRGGGFDYHDVSSILASIIELKPDIRPMDCERIFSKSVFSVIGKDDFSTETLRQAVEYEERCFRSIRRKPFVLVTHISIDQVDQPIKRTRWDTSTITFTPTHPSQFSHGQLTATLANLRLTNIPQWWLAVRVTDSGRTEEEAAFRAMDNLTTLRAVWNLAKNRGILHQMQSPVHRPVNEIRIGPVQTVHMTTGENASNCFWYERPYVAIDYPGRPTRFRPDEWARVRQFEKVARSQLKRMSYKQQFEGLLREYAETLDGVDHENAVQRLWTLLEKLTFCSEGGGANYDKLVKRTSFIWKESSLTALVLEHLRDVRNNTVHELRSHHQQSTCFYQLLRLVHEMLIFHLRSAGNFDSLREAGDFLQLSKDPKYLKAEIRRREQALQFIGHRPKRKK